MTEYVQQGGQEVIGVGRITGPIVVVEGVGSIGYDEVVEVIDSQGLIGAAESLKLEKGSR